MKHELIEQFITHYNANHFEKIDFDTEEAREFYNILFDVGYIEYKKNGTIAKKNKNQLFCGTLSVKSKFGFVYTTGDDIYIHKTNDYFTGDYILGTIKESNYGSSTEGEIIGLFSREEQKIICSVRKEKNLIAHDTRYAQYSFVFKKKSDYELFSENQMIQLTIIDVKAKNLIVKFSRVIADNSDPDLQMKITLASFGIETEFSDETLKQIETINEVDTSEVADRVDLRNFEVMTIDGKESKDLDDAIHMIKEGDNFRLTVSIADVSHYVQEGTPLDLDAYSRATSVYFVDRVVPMLPKKLSNGICSLHPGVDRLTISCEMLIDNKGEVIDSKIFPSIINSKYRLTYDDVNEMIINNKCSEEFMPIYSVILEMNKLKNILSKKRTNRGSFNLEDKDAKFKVNEDGAITDIIPVSRKDGEKLIEEFMILANETVASTIFWMDLPYIYRVHDQPTLKKLTDVFSMFKLLGITIKGDPHEFKPQMFKQALDQVDDPISKRIVSDLIVRSLSKARYQENNIGHFGLASKCYTHFTSPIRRYPDLVVHRGIRQYLFNKDMSAETGKYKEIGKHTSEKEVSAIRAEQAIEDMKKSKYMEQFIGDTYEGVVASFLDYGFFVELSNTVRGLIRFRNIKEFTKVVNYKVMFSDKTVLTLGDKVKVKLESVNEERGIVEFELVEYTMVKGTDKDRRKKVINNRKGSTNKDKKPSNFNSKNQRRRKFKDTGKKK